MKKITVLMIVLLVPFVVFARSMYLWETKTGLTEKNVFVFVGAGTDDFFGGDVVEVWFHIPSAGNSALRIKVGEKWFQPKPQAAESGMFFIGYGMGELVFAQYKKEDSAFFDRTGKGYEGFPAMLDTLLEDGFLRLDIYDWEFNIIDSFSLMVFSDNLSNLMLDYGIFLTFQRLPNYN